MNSMESLRQTVARLRGPGGCPWDLEQTHQTLAEHLVEESMELLDAIDRGDDPHMCEELGDVLLQVVLHAQIAADRGAFDLEAVAAEINEKLIRRHPHVFGDVALQTSEQVLHQWDRIKAGEKTNGPARDGFFKPIPPRLPALLFARDVFKQMVKRGAFPQPGPAAPPPLPAPLPDPRRIGQLAEGLTEEAAGAALFEWAAACRTAGIDPESALRRHARRVMEAVEHAHPAP